MLNIDSRSSAIFRLRGPLYLRRLHFPTTSAVHPREYAAEVAGQQGLISKAIAFDRMAPSPSREKVGVRVQGIGGRLHTHALGRQLQRPFKVLGNPLVVSLSNHQRILAARPSTSSRPGALLTSGL